MAVHIVTVSDTRTLETDSSGRAIAELLGGAGHVVHGRTVLKDEPADVAAKVTALVADPAVDAVISRTEHGGRDRRDGRHRHHVARQYLRGG